MADLTNPQAAGYELNVGREITFPTSETPKKIENFLKKRFPIGYVRTLFRKNAVRLNGKRCKPQDVARPGNRIELYIPFEKPADDSDSRVMQRSKLKILSEDGEFLFVDKPSGLAVHEGKDVLRRQSVLGLLESICRPRGVVPRLVHRLDKETSGLLLVAKEATVARETEALFERGQVAKKYLCLLAGRPHLENGRIDFPLPGRGGAPVRALTVFRVKERFSDTTLVEADLKTGRLHQVRLHFAKLGFPVVMDSRHGDFAFNKRFRKTYGLRRQFLHASSMEFEFHGKKRFCRAPLPADLEQTLITLASDSGRQNNINPAKPRNK